MKFFSKKTKLKRQMCGLMASFLLSTNVMPVYAENADQVQTEAVLLEAVPETWIQEEVVDLTEEPDEGTEQPEETLEETENSEETTDHEEAEQAEVETEAAEEIEIEEIEIDEIEIDEIPVDETQVDEPPVAEEEVLDEILDVMIEEVEIISITPANIELMGDYEDGTYRGSGTGYRSTIVLDIVIEDNTIVAIEEVSQDETAGPWTRAVAIFEQIIDANSTDVDTVSQATYSSQGILEAVNDALAQAVVGSGQVFEGGSGSQNNPYIIADAIQLERFSQKVNAGNDYAGKYIELAGDLELNGEWVPIGSRNFPFAGFFCGGNYTISGLSMQENPVTYAGLFGYLATGAKVSDLKLTDVIIAQEVQAAEAGGIAGGTEAGVVIDNCQISGAIAATNAAGISYAGGVAGKIGQGSVLSNIFADVSVQALSDNSAVYAGGIAGLFANKSILINAGVSGTVLAETTTSSISAAGGIFASQAGTAYHVFSNCEVTGESADANKVLTGGICGMATNNTAIIQGYFSDQSPAAFMTASTTVTSYVVEQVVGLPAQELASADFPAFFNTSLSRAQRANAVSHVNAAANANMGDLQSALDDLEVLYAWTFTDTVALSEEAFIDDTVDESIFAGGSGTEAEPYLLETAAQLRAFARSLSNELKYDGIVIALNNDIDVAGEPWLPIGLGHYDFKGTFDGRSYEVSGIEIGSPESAYEEDAGDSSDTSKMTTYYGFFGVLGENAVVRNLGIKDGFISVKRSTSIYAGLLAGVTDRAYIDSCYTSGSVASETTHNRANAWSGGLVGQTIKGGIINSWTDAEVYCTTLGGLAEAGALIGMTNRSVVANCFAIGNTGGKASRDNGNEGMPAVSSLIGVNGGKVANCYALGDMKADSFSNYVGSFAGWSTGIARQFISYYNAQSVQNSNGTINDPVLSVGFMVSAGINDEGEPYDGTYHVGIESKELAFMQSQAFAELLNNNHNAFPMDLTAGESSNTGNQNAMGLPDFMRLRVWQLDDGLVRPNGAVVTTTYEDMTPVFEPDELDIVDGVYYGRAIGPSEAYLFVKMVVSEQQITTIEITDHQEGTDLDTIAQEVISNVIATQNYSQLSSDNELQKALKGAIAVAAQKAAIHDLTGYGLAPQTIFEAGDGTLANPYLIATEQQLVDFAAALNADEHFEDQFIRLEADLSLSGIDWLPAGGSGVYGFRGTFDGNDKVIRNMTIGSAEDPEIYCKSVGLFANLEAAKIKNLGIEEAVIYQRYLGDSIAYAGVLAGYYTENPAAASYIDFCYATGKIESYSAKQNDTGGLVGAVNRGTIANCYTDVTMISQSRDGYAYAGGISALPNRALLINNYALGRIQGTGNGARIQIGGIAGMNAGISINNYTNIDLVSANTTPDIGGIAGRVTGIGYVERAYYHEDALQTSGLTVISPARGTGTIVAGENYGRGVVIDLTGKSYSELYSVDFAELLNDNLADEALLARAEALLAELGSSIPTEVELREFVYTDTGVVFKDRLDNESENGSEGNGSEGNGSEGNGSEGNGSEGNGSEGNGSEGNGTGSETGNSGGSSSSGSSSSSSSGRTSSLTNQPVVAEVVIAATAQENQTAAVTISDAHISEVISQAEAAAKAQAKAALGIGVVIRVTVPENSTGLTAAISKAGLQNLLNHNVKSFEVKGAPITITLDQKALEMLNQQSERDLTMTIKAASLLNLRSGYEFSIKADDTIITSLGEGSARIAIPYVLAEPEKAGGLYGVKADTNGVINRITNSIYDAAGQRIIFLTTDCAVYGLSYTAPAYTFTDIKNDSDRVVIDYVVSRSLFQGTSESTFAPEAAISTVELAAVFGKLAQAGNGEDTQWAYQAGVIAKALENQENQSVTREEMAVMIQNYAKATGYSLPVLCEAAAFTDAASIEADKKGAVLAVQQAGLMTAAENNRFDPLAVMTRSQAAAVLVRYIKLTIDPNTGTGWMLNQSGQYVYYRDGRMLTGAQVVDGISYQFSSEGIMQKN